MIGQRLNSAMLARGWTQSDLARESGLRQAHISQIINADRRPRFELMIPLARALDVSLDWLAGLPPREPEALEPDEDELLRVYRSMDKSHKDAMLSLGRSLEGKGK